MNGNWYEIFNVVDIEYETPHEISFSVPDYGFYEFRYFICDTFYQHFVGFSCPVDIPNVFTPNGDSQYDTWDIGFLSLFPGCNVKIFNRWGQLLFNSDGYNEDWDGRYNGNDLPTADYYYIINLKNGTEPLTGTITIIR